MKGVCCLRRSLNLCLGKPLMRMVWVGLTLPRAGSRWPLRSPSSPLSATVLQLLFTPGPRDKAFLAHPSKSVRKCLYMSPPLPFYSCYSVLCIATLPSRIHTVGYWLATRQRLGCVHLRPELLSLILQDLTRYVSLPHASIWPVPSLRSTTLSAFCNSGFLGFRCWFLRGSRDRGYLSAGWGQKSQSISGSARSKPAGIPLPSPGAGAGQQTPGQSKVIRRSGCALRSWPLNRKFFSLGCWCVHLSWQREDQPLPVWQTGSPSQYL